MSPAAEPDIQTLIDTRISITTAAATDAAAQYRAGTGYQHCASAEEAAMEEIRVRATAWELLAEAVCNPY